MWLLEIARQLPAETVLKKCDAARQADPMRQETTALKSVQRKQEGMQ